MKPHEKKLKKLLQNVNTATNELRIHIETTPEIPAENSIFAGILLYADYFNSLIHKALRNLSKKPSNTTGDKKA